MGAESAEQDETPWSICDEPLATALTEASTEGPSNGSRTPSHASTLRPVIRSSSFDCLCRSEGEVLHAETDSCIHALPENKLVYDGLTHESMYSDA